MAFKLSSNSEEVNPGSFQEFLDTSDASQIKDNPFSSIKFIIHYINMYCDYTFDPTKVSNEDVSTFIGRLWRVVTTYAKVSMPILNIPDSKTVAEVSKFLDEHKVETEDRYVLDAMVKVHSKIYNLSLGIKSLENVDNKTNAQKEHIDVLKALASAHHTIAKGIGEAFMKFIKESHEGEMFRPSNVENNAKTNSKRRKKNASH